MEKDRLIHDYIVQCLIEKLQKDYKEITENITGQHRAVGTTWPDIVLANHGIVLAAVEVETEQTLSEVTAKKWKAIVEEGIKLIVLIPKDAKKKTTQLLWDQAIAEKVSIGTYELNIKMP